MKRRLRVRFARDTRRVRRVWVAVGVLLTAAVLLVGVFPTRSYVEQRRDIAAAEARLAVLRAENARLEARLERLDDDAEIERLAREQYGLVKPGEEAYAILPEPGDPNPPPGSTTEAPRPRPRPFWQRVVDAITFWN